MEVCPGVVVLDGGQGGGLEEGLEEEDGWMDGWGGVLRVGIAVLAFTGRVCF